MTTHREQRRKDAKASERAVHDIVRERQGKPPARRVKLSEATPEDHLKAQGGDILIIPDSEEN